MRPHPSDELARKAVYVYQLAAHFRAVPGVVA
jgi:hypothetical protein